MKIPFELQPSVRNNEGHTVRAFNQWGFDRWPQLITVFIAKFLEDQAACCVHGRHGDGIVVVHIEAEYTRRRHGSFDVVPGVTGHEENPAIMRVMAGVGHLDAAVDQGHAADITGGTRLLRRNPGMHRAEISGYNGICRNVGEVVCREHIDRHRISGFLRLRRCDEQQEQGDDKNHSVIGPEAGLRVSGS